MFDANGDGKISRDELTKMMTTLGQEPSDKEINDIRRTSDKDGKYQCSIAYAMHQATVVAMKCYRRKSC